MYFLKMKDAGGEYIASDGTRYSIVMVRRIRTAQGINAGYEEFASLEDALTAWGLCYIHGRAVEYSGEYSSGS